MRVAGGVAGNLAENFTLPWRQQRVPTTRNVCKPSHI
jgi:hypothetical protein